MSVGLLMLISCNDSAVPQQPADNWVTFGIADYDGWNEITRGSELTYNLLKETGVTERLSDTAQNGLMNIVTLFLGISVGATATAATFLSWKTIIIVLMGVIAFGVATASGVLIAKLMNVFLPEGKKINPLIGSAGVSAVPMAARVANKVGLESDPTNFLLMHAMGPNVSGVIGSAVVAGVLYTLCS